FPISDLSGWVPRMAYAVLIPEQLKLKPSLRGEIFPGCRTIGVRYQSKLTGNLYGEPIRARFYLILPGFHSPIRKARSMYRIFWCWDSQYALVSVEESQFL